MFLRRPSPLSLKVRTKIAELYLLPKKEIFAISKKILIFGGKYIKKIFIIWFLLNIKPSKF